MPGSDSGTKRETTPFDITEDDIKSIIKNIKLKHVLKEHGLDKKKEKKGDEFSKLKFDSEGIQGCDSSGNYIEMIDIDKSGVSFRQVDEDGRSGLKVGEVDITELIIVAGTEIARVMIRRFIDRFTQWFNVDEDSNTVTIPCNLQVGGNIDLKGEAEVGGDLNVKGDVVGENNLKVNEVEVVGNLEVVGWADIKGSMHVQGKVDLDSDIHVKGDVDIEGSLIDSKVINEVTIQ